MTELLEELYLRGYNVKITTTLGGGFDVTVWEPDNWTVLYRKVGMDARSLAKCLQEAFDKI